MDVLGMIQKALGMHGDHSSVKASNSWPTGNDAMNVHCGGNTINYPVVAIHRKLLDPNRIGSTLQLSWLLCQDEG